MWAFILRKILYNIPIFLAIIMIVMGILRVRDPAVMYAGKQKSEEQLQSLREKFGLDQPFLVQYWDFLSALPTLDLGESWSYPGKKVRDKMLTAIPASMSITIPTLLAAGFISVCVGMVSAFYRGRQLDRSLVIFAVLGMSISYLVYVIMGQYFFAYLPKAPGNEVLPDPFAISGYESWTSWNYIDLKIFKNFRIPYPSGAPQFKVWITYCMLPVIVGVIVQMGYDTRFYRAVMVEECNRDYIITAKAKGASKTKIMFVHMLKNAMIPIITRVMISLPFLITGSIVLEKYFNIPGMGKMLIDAVNSLDFPMVQGFSAVIALLYIVSIILTDVLYALVDPRVRLS